MNNEFDPYKAKLKLAKYHYLKHAHNKRIQKIYKSIQQINEQLQRHQETPEKRYVRLQEKVEEQKHYIKQLEFQTLHNIVEPEADSYPEDPTQIEWALSSEKRNERLKDRYNDYMSKREYYKQRRQCQSPKRVLIPDSFEQGESFENHVSMFSSEPEDRINAKIQVEDDGNSSLIINGDKFDISMVADAMAMYLGTEESTFPLLYKN